jgi:hypothetical protein
MTSEYRNNQGEVVIPLKHGSIVCGPGHDYDLGGFVQILDDSGKEYAYWECNEWEEDPECVMGAIFGAIESMLEGKPSPSQGEDNGTE